MKETTLVAMPSCFHRWCDSDRYYFEDILSSHNKVRKNLKKIDYKLLNIFAKNV